MEFMKDIICGLSQNRDCNSPAQGDIFRLLDLRVSLNIIDLLTIWQEPIIHNVCGLWINCKV